MHAFREMNSCFSANQFKKVNLSSNEIVLRRDFNRNIIVAEYTRKTDQVNTRWNVRKWQLVVTNEIIEERSVREIMLA